MLSRRFVDDVVKHMRGEAWKGIKVDERQNPRRAKPQGSHSE
jgi:hypothetical protein